jgi:hypothetical protein
MDLEFFNLEEFQAQVDVPGLGKVRVSWDTEVTSPDGIIDPEDPNSTEKVLSFRGVNDLKTLFKVLERLTGNSVSGLRFGTGEPKPPLATVVDLPNPAQLELPFPKPAVKNGLNYTWVEPPIPPPPLEDLTKLSAAEIRARFPIPAVGLTTTLTSTPPDDDYSAFSSLDSFKDIVKELVRRGHDTLEKVKAAAKDVQDSGCSPLLVRTGDKLNDRIVATATALKLMGTVAG